MTISSPSYLKLALGTYNADVVTLPGANVPATMRNAVSFRYYPAYDIPHDAWDLIVLYSDGYTSVAINFVLEESDMRVVVYDTETETPIYYVMSDHVTASRNQPLDITIIREYGALILKGFSIGDGTYIGTPWAASNGDVVLGASRTGTNHAFGLISEPELYQDPTELYFSQSVFTNTTNRYVLLDGSMTDSFGSGVKASRKFGPYTYAQLESAHSTLNTYSQQFSSVFVTSDYLDITDDAADDPLGDATADFLYEKTTDSVEHYRSMSLSFTTGTKYVFSCYFKAAQRDEVRFTNDNWGISATGISIDLATGTWTDSYVGNPVTWGIVKPAGNSWYYCAYGTTCPGSGSSNIIITMMKDGNTTYAGEEDSGLYAWGCNVVEGAFPKSYIYAGASVGTVNKDELYYSYSVLPSRMKGSSINSPFSFSFIPNFSDTQLVADGNKHCLFSVGETEGYIDSSQKIKIDVAGVNKFTSCKKYWNAQQTLGITIIPNYDGVLCRVITKGFSIGNGIETGVSFSLLSGGLFYLGSQCFSLSSDVAATLNTYPKYITYGSSMTGQFPTKTTLASGAGDLYDCCADATHVYFCDYTGNRVGRVAIGGGTPEYIATGLNGPQRLCVDSTNVYFGEFTAGKIDKVNKTTLVKTELATGLATSVRGVCCDATNVYFCVADKVSYVPIAGGAVVDLATGQNLAAVVYVDATNAYWSEYSAGKVHKVAKTGGAITDLVTGVTTPGDLVVNGTTVYFLTSTTVSSVPVAGGAVTNIVSGLSSIFGLSVDDAGTRVYYSYGTGVAGKLCSVLIAGGSTDTLATGLSDPFAGVYCANNMVYCAEKGGSISSYPETPNAPIRNIDGKDYLQVEKANTENILYNESFNTVAYWSGLMALPSVTVTANQAVSPIGTLTMDSIVENATTNYHGIYRGGLSLAAPQIFSIFVKTIPGSATRYLRLQTDYSCNDTFFDAVTGTFTRLSGLHTGHFAYSVGNGIWHIGFCTTATAKCYCLAISDSPDTLRTHLGDGVSGYYIWGASIQNGYYSQSYIQTTSAAETRTKTTSYFPSAVVPSWLRGSTAASFTFDFIPEYSSTILTTVAEDRYLFSINNATSVDCYIDATDNTIKIDVGGVNKFTSSAKTWDIAQKLTVTITPNNGANCVVTTSGFTTGDATETSTIFDLQSSGDLYLGLKHTTNDLQLDGLISVPTQGSSVDQFDGFISEPNFGWYNLLTLPNKRFTFVNTFSRYITYAAQMTGVFSSGVKALRNINGIDHFQIESSGKGIGKYSEDLNTLAVSKTGVTVSSDVIASPIGTITADKYVEDASNGWHGAWWGASMNGTITSGKQYVFSLYVKAGERSKVRMSHDSAGFGGGAGITYDCATDTLAWEEGTVDWMYRQVLSDGWVYVAMADTSSTGGVGTSVYIHIKDGSNSTYQGIAGYGLYLWGIEIQEAYYPRSYIPTTSTSPVLRNADIISCNNYGLPSWLKGSATYPFSFSLCPNYSSTQLTTATGKRYIFSIKATASVDCYLDGADNTIKIDVDSVNKFTSGVKTWDRQQNLLISILPTSGASCIVSFYGFTEGNGEETGTAFSLQTDGKFYLGCAYDTYDQQFDGLVSEPVYSDICVNGALQYISFSTGTYINPSPKNVWHNGASATYTGGFVPTLSIDGITYALFEGQAVNKVLYSEDITNSYWTNNTLATLTGEKSPFGDTTSVRKLTSSGVTLEQVREYRSQDFVQGTASAFIKKGTQGSSACLRYSTQAFPTGYLNITPSTSWERKSVYRNYGANKIGIYNCLDGDNLTNAATGDNIFWYGMQVEAVGSCFSTSYIRTNGSEVTRTKDKFYWKTEAVPTWLRSGFEVNIIPEYSSAELAADSGFFGTLADKYICEYNGLAVAVSVYINAADQKVYLYSSSAGTLASSATLTWSAFQTLTVKVVFNNGANSVITTSGFTAGDGTVTGTSCTVENNYVYWGMSRTEANHIAGFISTPIPV